VLDVRLGRKTISLDLRIAACLAIAGIEAVQMIRKGQVPGITKNFIANLADEQQHEKHGGADELMGAERRSSLWLPAQ